MMHVRAVRRLAAFSALAFAGSAGFLHGDPARPYAPETFLDSARRGTTRYRAQREAINDGYTKVGGEFPAMGEHWVSFARILEDSLDPARPSVLIYINTDSGPRLAGLAYSKLLTGSTNLPSFPFDHAWHEHSGAVNEESLPLMHGMHSSSASLAAPNRDSPRLFILHAWTQARNPDGDFATDNWTLPALRLGAGYDGHLASASQRAIALARDDEGYYRFVIGNSLALPGAADTTLARIISSHRQAALRLVRRWHHEFGRKESEELTEVWDSLWNELASQFPGRSEELANLRKHM